MVPLTAHATRNSIKVSEFLSEERLSQVKEDTKVGGATLTKLLGTSAWYAPGAAAAQMVEAIVRDQKRIFPVCAWLQGEYGMNDIFLGVPVVLGKNGIEKIIELDLNEEEKAMLQESSEAVRGVMSVLDNMNINA
jgi:malate dehydrogenase